MILRPVISRLPLLIAVLGCAVLALSVLDWAQTQRAKDGAAWVDARSSNAPAIENAEIWQASAGCERPFFIKAALRSKAFLRNHYSSAPDEVRAWHDVPSGGDKPRYAAAQIDLPVLVSDQRRAQLWNATADREYGAKLHAQYAEWYATASRLEKLANHWEKRLIDISDQKVTIAEATRRSFRAYSDVDAGTPAAKGSFDHYVLFLLGLGGFSSEEEQAIKANCVSIVPVKKVARSAHYLRDLWRWPIDHIAAFSLGLELVLIGILFAPIVRWIDTGDGASVRQDIYDAANRVRVKILNLHRHKAVLCVLRACRSALAGILSSGRSLLFRFSSASMGVLIWILGSSIAIVVGLHAFLIKPPVGSKIHFG
jgi:hypothetical protein